VEKMQSKKYHELFLKILKECNSIIVRKEELKNIIKSYGSIEELSKDGFIHQEKNMPTQCPVYGCDSRDIELEFKDDKIVITDLQNTDHRIEESIDKWISCELNVQKIVQILLESIFDSIECSSTVQIENMHIIQTIFEENDIDIIFSFSGHIHEDELFKALSPSLIFKRPLILITKDTQENFEEINSICLKIPLGNFVYPFYIQDFENKESGEDLKDWINRILEIRKMEKEFLGELPKKRSELVYNIDINPKYLLSFLVRLKAYKSKKGQEKYDWKEMENAISVAFRYLYHSDIRYGGGLQPGKNVPDNIFFVKNHESKKFDLTGIVDAKFSKAVDLNTEKTEKYEEYLELARINPYAPKRIALIFPLIGVKTDTTIQKFFDRLKKRMKTEEFCLILPIETLEILVYLYMSSIIRGKLDLSETDFINIREQIFNIDFLERNCKLDSGLYKVDFNDVKNLIREITGKESTVEFITSKIMDKK
jgi:hypothetical protein